MDSRVFCVYNLVSGVFLSTKVVIADGANQPLKVLKVLVSALALDSESGIWLTPLNGVPAVPRLFPFDLAYLDADLRVIHAVEVSQYVELPPHRPDFSSALVLPSDTLRFTQTQLGHQLSVCLQQEAGQFPNAGASCVFTRVAASEEPEGLPIPAPFSTEPSDNAVSSTTLQAIEPESAIPAHHIVGAVAGVAEAQPARVAEATSQQSQMPVSLSQGGHRAPVTEASKTESASTVEVGIVDTRNSQTAQTEKSDIAKEIFANWVESPEAASVLTEKKPWSVAPGPDAIAPSRIYSVALPGEPIGKSAEMAHTIAAQPAPEDAFDEGADLLSRAPVSADGPTSNVAEFKPAAPAEKMGLQPAYPQKAPDVREVGTAGESTETSTAASTENTHTLRSSFPQLSPMGSFTVAQYSRWQVSAPTAIIAATSSPSGKIPVRDIPKSGNSIAREEHPVPRDVAQPKKESAEAEPASSQVEQGNKEPGETATGSGQRGVAAMSAATEDLTRRIERAVKKSAPRWPIEPIGESPLVHIRQPAERPTRMGETSDDSQTEKIIEPTESSTPTPFASLLQDKLKGLGVRDSAPVEAEELSPLSALRISAEQGSQAKSERQRKLNRGGIGGFFRQWSKSVDRQSERRRAQRRNVPGMVAHYFSGGAPRPHDVSDISMTGFYLLTEDRWMPETMIQMTLQKPGAKGGIKRSITVLSKVVRQGPDGVAVEFVMPGTLDTQGRDFLAKRATDSAALARFI